MYKVMSYGASDTGIMLKTRIKMSKIYIIGVCSKKSKGLQKKRYIIETRNIFKSILYLSLG